MAEIKQLVWDDWNIEHIARHNVTRKNVEAVFRGNFVHRPTYNGRLLIIGRDDTENLLTIILGNEGDSQYYVVTARSAAKKERRLYRAWEMENQSDEEYKEDAEI